MTLAVVASPDPERADPRGGGGGAGGRAGGRGAAYGHVWGTVQVVIGAPNSEAHDRLPPRRGFSGLDVLRRMFGDRVDAGLLGSQTAVDGRTVFFLGQPP